MLKDKDQDALSINHTVILLPVQEIQQSAKGTVLIYGTLLCRGGGVRP